MASGWLENVLKRMQGVKLNMSNVWAKIERIAKFVNYLAGRKCELFFSFFFFFYRKEK